MGDVNPLEAMSHTPLPVLLPPGQYCVAVLQEVQPYGQGKWGKYMGPVYEKYCYETFSDTSMMYDFLLNKISLIPQLIQTGNIKFVLPISSDFTFC